MYHYSWIMALDLAQERAREAAEAHRRSLVVRSDAPSPIRRGLARAIALVSLAAAALARALDERVADDLRRSLAPTK
jgi:hypothetical protein